ncbi:MAG TPA: penicillin-binding transpeptidase domain-containing protein [Candidatus Sulfotelmatobacter sp.]|nr:penicillin-binding transpeptidase domain-containing protein [Candidatus Sulfotelmatobacter sp.]
MALPLVLICLLAEPSRGGPESGVVEDQFPSLFAQSAARSLDRDFPGRDISFLLLDARTGEVLASRWDHPETPIPLGSLVKPSAALAYGQNHDFRYPTHTCRGTASGCWRPDGHGTIGLSSAIAYSCNSYFRALTADLIAPDIVTVAERFGIETPDPKTSGVEFAGFGSSWKIAPMHVARAYIELSGHQQRREAAQILVGMSESARIGTAAEVDRALSFPNALAKTGTAACTHSRHAPGDGFTVALYPADEPQVLLLVRVHGVPGSQAAKTAGLMLHKIED